MLRKNQTFMQYCRALERAGHKGRVVLNQEIVKEKGLLFAESLDRYRAMQEDHSLTLSIHRIIQYKQKARERFKGDEWRSVRLELMKAWRRHIEANKEINK